MTLKSLERTHEEKKQFSKRLSKSGEGSSWQKFSSGCPPLYTVNFKYGGGEEGGPGRGGMAEEVTGTG